MIDSTIPSKRCSVCNLTKPLEEFPFTTWRNAKGEKIPTAREACKPCYKLKESERNKRKYRKDHTLTRRPPSMPFEHPVTGETMKICQDCGLALPLDGFPFSSGKTRPRCLYCYRAQTRGAYANNPGYWIGRAIEWGRKNPEKKRNKDQRYRANHASTINARRRPHNRAYMAKRRLEAPEAVRRRLNEYRLRSGKGVELQQKYRAIKHGTNPASINPSVIIERDGMACYICSRQLSRRQVTLDHIIPLSRGGNHSPENLKVCCRSCNSRKHNKLLSELDWVCFLPRFWENL